MRPRLVDFTGIATTPSVFSIPINRTCFLYLFNTIFGFARFLFRTGSDFKASDFGASFFFWACFWDFSSIRTSSILSPLTAACNALSAFSASILAFFSARATLLASIRARSDFSKASFLANRACASRTLAAEKYIGSVYSLPSTLSFFPRTLFFFSSFRAPINPSLTNRSSSACVDNLIFALKSFLSFSFCDGRNGAEVVSQRSLFQGLTKT